MKEYISSGGGRYTYADDVLNLQELALSMTSVFSACSDFIISGCDIIGNEITPGYVWIGGKVRSFTGCPNAVFPYFIWEKNENQSVVYANDENKVGRTCHECVGGPSVPNTNDSLTGKLPRFLEINKDYAPRFIDKFIGKYALLLDSPFSQQTVKKDVLFAGTVRGDKDIESKTSISVMNPQNGYTMKNIVRANGDASIGVYLNGLLINEIVISTDGSFLFMKQGQEYARINEQGVRYDTASSRSSQIGSIYISDNNIVNSVTDSDYGAVVVNYSGYQNGSTRFRDFMVFDGRQNPVPLFHVEGKTRTVNANGLMCVRNSGLGIELKHSHFLKSDPKLINTITWRDSLDEIFAFVGFNTTDSFDFSIRNTLGDMILHPQSYVDVKGGLKINGDSIEDTYVSLETFTDKMKKKVDVVTGKQLSAEDFTSALKHKLDSMFLGTLESGSGIVSAGDVKNALNLKLGRDENFADLTNKASARINLDVYSKAEAGSTFLKISNKLIELVNLTPDEVNNITAEEATALKAKKQQAVRDTLDAEKKGTGELKLAKSANLSDLPDKLQARKNLSIYSAQEVDDMLAGKLDSSAGYSGVVFTPELRDKLNSIKPGNFAYVDAESKAHSLVDGYVTAIQVKTEVDKKANLLMDGLNSTQKESIASNLSIYTKTAADAKFVAVDQLFQDYINYLVKTGKSTADAQKTLREKLDVYSKTDVNNTFMRRDGYLSDMTGLTTDKKKLACQYIGAAYSSDYQTKIIDTGWMQMANYGVGTDTSRLFIRQIGNIVSIQGVINTARREGSHWGGVIAMIPNQIPPPKYGLRTEASWWNDDHKFNRGCSFIIGGGSRYIQLFESGWYNQSTDINFTYFT